MKKGHTYHLETCPECGKQVPFNWYIRHLKEVHQQEAKHQAQEERQNRLKAIYELGIPGLHTFHLISKVMGVPRGTVKSLMDGHKHWTDELEERLQLVEWVAYEYENALDMIRALDQRRGYHLYLPPLRFRKGGRIYHLPT